MRLFELSVRIWKEKKGVSAEAVSLKPIQRTRFFERRVINFYGTFVSLFGFEIKE